MSLIFSGCNDGNFDDSDKINAIVSALATPSTPSSILPPLTLPDVLLFGGLFGVLGHCWATPLQHLHQNGQEFQSSTVKKIVHWRKFCNTNQGSLLSPPHLLRSCLIDVGSNRVCGGGVRCRLVSGSWEFMVLIRNQKSTLKLL